MKKLLLLILPAIILFSCKQEEINPMPSTKKNILSYLIESSASDAKVFRLLGGSTGLPEVDLNSDPGFVASFDNNVQATAIQADGKIIIGGEFTSYNGVPANRIVRANSDGSIDNSFVYGTGFDNYPSSIAVQSDGKILIGGLFSTYNGTAAGKIIRLNSDGSIDGSFVYGTGFVAPFGVEWIMSIKIQSDNKIVLGGVFTSYNGTSASKIIRLNSNGTVDGSFVYGSGFDTMFSSSYVGDIEIQSDGKIIVAGSFSTYKGTGANRIIRIDSDGSIDGTFVYGSGFDFDATSVAIQSNGKILVGGSFSSYNGTGSNRIVRLNSDGTIDGSFVYGTGLNGNVNDIKIQSDDKIIIGGAFTSYNGSTASKIIRINSDGSVDNLFGSGFDNNVNSVSIQSDGKIIAGGKFIDYNSTTANYIIRLKSDSSVDSPGEYVTITVNGGAFTPEEVNADISNNPICIEAVYIVTENQGTFSVPLSKKKRLSTGTTEEEKINLLAKYNANFAQDKVTLETSDFSSCILDGFNYLEWTIPAGEKISIEIQYTQDARSLALGHNTLLLKTVSKKKKYVHKL